MASSFIGKVISHCHFYFFFLSWQARIIWVCSSSVCLNFFDIFQNNSQWYNLISVVWYIFISFALYILPPARQYSFFLYFHNYLLFELKPTRVIFRSFCIHPLLVRRINVFPSSLSGICCIGNFSFSIPPITHWFIGHVLTMLVMTFS